MSDAAGGLTQVAAQPSAQPSGEQPAKAGMAAANAGIAAASADPASRVAQATAAVHVVVR
jgi:hypothetical protein